MYQEIINILRLIAKYLKGVDEQFTGSQTSADSIISGTLSDDRLSSNIQRKTEKGANNGYAGLDGSGKVPSSNLPTASSASYTVSGVTKVLTTGAQLATAIDEGEKLDFALTGQALVDHLGGNYMDSLSVTDAIDSALSGSGFLDESGAQSLIDSNLVSALSGSGFLDESGAQSLIDSNLVNYQGLTVAEFNAGVMDRPTTSNIVQENRFEVSDFTLQRTKRFESFEDAVNGASDRSTITCFNDALISTSLPFKNITIDGNGFSLTVDDSIEMFTTTLSDRTLTIKNFKLIEIDPSYTPNAMFNPDGANITINLINNLKISSPVRLIDADGANCKVNIVGSLLENCKWATTGQNWANASNMADFYTAGCELNIDRCTIRGWNSIGEINDSSSVRVTNSTIWNKFLYGTNWACTQKFINCTIKCQSSKLNAGISYAHATFTGKANAITITGCDITSVGDKSLDYGVTYESFFCCPNPLGKLIINSTTFKLTAPSGVTPYYLFKPYTGSSIGKIGLNGVITSHDKDSGVTPVFGSLVVSSDLI